MSAPLGLFVEAGVLERHGGVIGEGLRQPCLLGRERAARAITNHEHAGDAAVSDHRHRENGARAARRRRLLGVDRDLAWFIGQKVFGEDHAAFACGQRDGSVALDQNRGGLERLSIASRHEESRRVVGVESEKPCSLRVEQDTSAVRNPSGHQVAIEGLSEKTAQVGKGLGRPMGKRIRHTEYRVQDGCPGGAQRAAVILTHTPHDTPLQPARARV